MNIGMLLVVLISALSLLIVAGGIREGYAYGFAQSDTGPSSKIQVSLQ